MKKPQGAILAAIAVVVLSLGAFVVSRDNGSSTETEATQTGGSLPPLAVDTIPTTAPLTPIGSIVEPEPDSAQDAVSRIQETGVIKSEDLRLIMLDAASYDKAFKQYIGPGEITNEGAAVIEELAPSLVTGLSTPVGYVREWTNEAGTYQILEEAIAFQTPQDAAEYLNRYVTQARAAGIPEIPQVSPRTDYLAEFDTRETPFACRSVALLQNDRLVVTVTVFHADCEVSTAVWSAKLADIAVQIAKAGLGR